VLETKKRLQTDTKMLVTQPVGQNVQRYIRPLQHESDEVAQSSEEIDEMTQKLEREAADQTYLKSIKF